ncbi:MAG: flagellin [Paracoccaceae bacterium]|nr:flagellin [Paracoccaceae bacterium]
MALGIATNNAALQAAAAASSVNREMETSMARLSTGKRINSASDDAAGVAIASRLTAEVRGTDQAVRNALDAQALIDTAEGGHKEIESILQRMREVAVQAGNDTNSAGDRANLQAEMDALLTEVDRIASTTTWAGQSLMSSSGKTMSFQVGSATGTKNQIAVTIGRMDTASAGLDMKVTASTGTHATNATTQMTLATKTFTIVASQSVKAKYTNNGTGLGDIESAVASNGAGGVIAAASSIAEKINEDASYIAAGISALDHGNGTFTVTDGTSHGHMMSSTAALDAVKNIDAAITEVNTQRSSLGAVSNRLGHTIANLTNISSNLSAAKGSIEDADFAMETTQLAKNQILQQASTAMLAQANVSKQNVLRLLQG